MAGKKISIGKKVRASSILEVLISMVVILIVFSIAMAIYTNVLKLSLSIKKIRAQAALQDILIKSEYQGKLSDDSFSTADFRIEQEVRTVENFQRLSSVHLTAYDDNQQKVAELQKLIIQDR
jgi:Tfp pilus assembly protein PilE